jgi:RNA polymerase sigma-70 factor (ECF subfamily)
MFYFSALPGLISTREGRQRGGHTDTVGHSPAGAPEIDSALPSEDTQRLTLLYEGFRRPIYTYIYRLLGNQEDAADATQEVFLRACMNWEKLRERKSLGEWLYRVATNLCIDLLRKRKRLSWWKLPRRTRDERGDEGESEEETSAFLSAEHGGILVVAEREHIQLALARLPHEYAVVLVLSVVQGIPCREIASIIGLSPGATASRLSRAKRCLSSSTSASAKKMTGSRRNGHDECRSTAITQGR